MPRKRIDIVTETLAQLLEMERRSSGASRTRLKALRLIKERPADRLGDIAESLKVSVRVLERWWAAYRHGGLEAMLATKQRGGYRPSKVDEEILQEISRKRSRGELCSQSDVQRWLQDEHGITLSRSGAGYLLKRRSATAGTNGESSNGEVAGTRDMPAAKSTGRKAGEKEITVRGLEGARPVHKLPDSALEGEENGMSSTLLLTMINSLPRNHDAVGWIRGFEKALAPLLPDVDRISIEINSECDLLNPAEYMPDMRVLLSHQAHSSEVEVAVTAAHKRGEIAAYVIEKLAAGGAPVHESHPPIGREYFYEGTAYLGTLVFWRDKDCPPISARTLQRIDQVEPFITFMLSDLVLRNDYARPLNRVFHDILRTIVVEAGLSFQERRVLNLRLFGESYKSIAAQLEISRNAVRKHLTSIHHKTGTHSTVQLFAKYFTPRLAAGEDSPR